MLCAHHTHSPIPCARDPNSAIEFSDILFGSWELVEAFSNALGDDGILVAQIGEIDFPDEPVWEASEEEDPNDDVLAVFIELLEESEFMSVTQYEESHCGFSSPWDFVLALKDNRHRATWLMNEAEMQLKLHTRLFRTIDGENSLKYFDGASFMNYQFPNRFVEDRWCRRYPSGCENGHGFDPELENVPLSNYKVISSKVANGGRGVETQSFIKKGTYLGINSCVNGIFVPSTTLEMIEDAGEVFSEHNGLWNTLYGGYIEGYVSLFLLRFLVWIGRHCI